MDRRCCGPSATAGVFDCKGTITLGEGAAAAKQEFSGTAMRNLEADASHRQPVGNNKFLQS
jgi:hypothetical protein